jgi:amino acid transporter
MHTAFIVFIAFLALATAVFFILKRKNKKKILNRSWKKLYSFTLTNFFLCLALLFLTDQAIPVFSSRFWFLILLVEMLIWLYLIKEEHLEIKKDLAKQKEKEEFNKYIP